MSIAKLGENHPLYGKHHSEETKRKMSIANSGENHYNYGKHLTEDTRKKMSIANSGENHPMYGKHWYNNGLIEARELECPEGFTEGRLKKSA